MLESILTLLVPLVGAAAIFLARGRRARLAVMIATTVVHLCLSAHLWSSWSLSPRPSATALIALDAAGLLFLSLVSLLYCLVAISLIAYTRNEARGAPPVFLACHLLSLAAMTLATLANHWALFWVAMEATTLATAPLLFYHHGPRSLEATWKSVLIGSVGIALALLGTLFLGMAGAQLSEPENLLVFGTMVAHAHELSVPWLKMGIVFLVVGYGTKMGLAPMHTWKPDAYGEAPPPVAALLSGGVTNVAFLGILRVDHLAGAAGEGAFLHSMLIVLGLSSLGIAAASILGQGNYRRLLAYSSVEHMGILALALGVGGTATFGGLLHAINNGLNKGILFIAAGNVLQATRTAEAKSVRGLLRTAPLTACFLVVGFLAATGFPPFGTFLSEFTILRGMVAEGRIVVTILFRAFLAIVFIGMAPIVLEMVQGEPSHGTAGDQGDARVPRVPRVDTLPSVLPLLILTLLILMLGVWVPPELQAVLAEAARGPAGGR